MNNISLLLASFAVIDIGLRKWHNFNFQWSVHCVSYFYWSTHVSILFCVFILLHNYTLLKRQLNWKVDYKNSIEWKNGHVEVVVMFFSVLACVALAFFRFILFRYVRTWVVKTKSMATTTTKNGEKKTVSQPACHLKVAQADSAAFQFQSISRWADSNEVKNSRAVFVCRYFFVMRNVSLSLVFWVL